MEPWQPLLFTKSCPAPPPPPAATVPPLHQPPNPAVNSGSLNVTRAHRPGDRDGPLAGKASTGGTEAVADRIPRSLSSQPSGRAGDPPGSQAEAQAKAQAEAEAEAHAQQRLS